MYYSHVLLDMTYFFFLILYGDKLLLALFEQWCVLVPVVLTLIANQEPDGTVGKYIAKFCYPRWALEAFVVASAQRLVVHILLLFLCTARLIYESIVRHPPN